MLPQRTESLKIWQCFINNRFAESLVVEATASPSCHDTVSLAKAGKNYFLSSKQSQIAMVSLETQQQSLKQHTCRVEVSKLEGSFSPEINQSPN